MARKQSTPNKGGVKKPTKSESEATPAPFKTPPKESVKDKVLGLFGFGKK